MKQLFTIIIWAALAFSVQAQTSAVTVNSAGKIVVPANGTLTSTGTITGNNIVSNLTLTAGNVTTAGAVTAANVTCNGTINATGGTFYNPAVGNCFFTVACPINYGASIALQEDGAIKAQFFYYQNYTGIDYTGDLDFRNGYSGVANGLSLPDAGGVKLGGIGYTTIIGVRSSSASIDFSNTVSGNTSTATITVTGATTTSTPSVSLGLSPAPPAGCVIDGYVSASNTVTVRFSNFSGSDVDPAAITIRATVTQF